MSKENTKDFPWQTLLRLFRLSKPYYKWYAVLVVITTLSSATAVVMTESFRRMINGAAEGSLSLLQSGLFIAIIVFAISLMLNLADQYFGPLLDHISSRRFSLLYLEKITKIRIRELKKYHSGELISRNDEAKGAQSAINNKARSILKNILTIIFIFFYLFYLNRILTLWVFVLAIGAPLLVTPLSKKLRDLYGKRYQAISKKNAFLQDIVQGAEIARTFSLGKRLENKFADLFERMLSFIKKTTILETIVGHSRFVVIIGGVGLVLGYGGSMVIKGLLDIGALVAFMISFEQIVGPVSELARTWPEFQNSIAQGKRVFEIMDMEEEEASLKGESDKEELKNIEKQLSVQLPILDIRNISFAYEKKKVLEEVSFAARAGEVIALVGPSGSGKSTILKILLGFYQVGSGDIIHYGFSLNSIPTYLWRDKIAYVSQNPCLFSGTIYENILQGNPLASESEVFEAAKQANIHNFIISTEKGYQTKVGERGIRLSGGEKQRVAIARAILKNPELLILDEPTSSLDSENEIFVQQALDKLMEDRTTIVVAHRLSTIRGADKIIFLEDGKIQESGNHHSLIEAKGKYYKMYLSHEGVV